MRALVLGCAVLGCGDNSNGWPSQLAAGSVGEITVGEDTFGSSSKLAVTWSQPPDPVDHFVVTATASVGGPTSASATVAAPGGAIELAGLASGTPYRIDLVACLDAGCATALDGGAITGTTPAERWQLDGTGDDVAGLHPIVSDGNSKVHAAYFGDGAPAEVAGRIQLYYGPIGMTVKGLAVGVGNAVVTHSVASFANFSSLSGTTGLVKPPSAGPLIGEINTGQAVPIADAVRLYFEATGTDGKSRILSIDSTDGLLGRDFATGAGTLCSTTQQYATGGACEPTLEIGVAGDAGADAAIAQARQFKIGYPTQDDWRWDQSAGTFMLLTVSSGSGCTNAMRQVGYAVYDGAAWQVVEDDDGCPRVFTDMQAPAPLHLGGGRYKLYSGNTADRTGALATPLPFLGPKTVLYADAARTGDPAVVDFDDWDSKDSAREVHFLWPSGARLDATAEGYIDDFVAMAPLGLDLQVLYIIITAGTDPPFGAMAVLLNP